jgi:hypothetical protein
MPDELRFLAQIFADSIPGVVIAIASREDNDTKSHKLACGEGEIQF